MTTNQNQVKIKVFGPLSAIKNEVSKIKTIYPLASESSCMLNNDQATFRIYLTLPLEKETPKKNSRFSLQLKPLTGGQKAAP